MSSGVSAAEKSLLQGNAFKMPPSIAPMNDAIRELLDMASARALLVIHGFPRSGRSTLLKQFANSYFIERATAKPIALSLASATSNTDIYGRILKALNAKAKLPELEGPSQENVVREMLREQLEKSEEQLILIDDADRVGDLSSLLEFFIGSLGTNKVALTLRPPLAIRDDLVPDLGVFKLDGLSSAEYAEVIRRSRVAVRESDVSKIAESLCKAFKGSPYSLKLLLSKCLLQKKDLTADLANTDDQELRASYLAPLMLELNVEERRTAKRMAAVKFDSTRVSQLYRDLGESTRKLFAAYSLIETDSETGVMRLSAELKDFLKPTENEEIDLSKYFLMTYPEPKNDSEMREFLYWARFATPLPHGIDGRIEKFVENLLHVGIDADALELLIPLATTTNGKTMCRLENARGLYQNDSNFILLFKKWHDAHGEDSGEDPWTYLAQGFSIDFCFTDQERARVRFTASLQKSGSQREAKLRSLLARASVTAFSDPREAQMDLEEALSMLEGANSPVEFNLLARATFRLAWLFEGVKQGEAQKLYLKAASLHRQEGNLRSATYCEINVLLISYSQGCFSLFDESLESCLKDIRRCNLHSRELNLLWKLVDLSYHRQDAIKYSIGSNLRQETKTFEQGQINSTRIGINHVARAGKFSEATGLLDRSLDCLGLKTDPYAFDSFASLQLAIRGHSDSFCSLMNTPFKTKDPNEIDAILAAFNILFYFEFFNGVKASHLPIEHFATLVQQYVNELTASRLPEFYFGASLYMSSVKQFDKAKKYAECCLGLAKKFGFSLWILRANLALWLAGESSHSLQWPSTIDTTFLFQIEASLIRTLSSQKMLSTGDQALESETILSKLIAERMAASSKEHPSNIRLNGKQVWSGYLNEIKLEKLNLNAVWDPQNAQLLLRERTLSIQDRPLIAKLLTVMVEGRRDWNKEDLVSAVWNENYNPIVHDTRVYTLIKRFRDFLEKELNLSKQEAPIEKLESGYRFNPDLKIGLIETPK